MNNLSSYCGLDDTRKSGSEKDLPVLNGHFGPVYLLQVSKNDDEEHCFLK